MAMILGMAAASFGTIVANNLSVVDTLRVPGLNTLPASFGFAMQCSIRSLNAYLSSEDCSCAEPDLAFEESSVFSFCGLL